MKWPRTKHDFIIDAASIALLLVLSASAYARYPCDPFAWIVGLGGLLLGRTTGKMRGLVIAAPGNRNRDIQGEIVHLYAISLMEELPRNPLAEAQVLSVAKFLHSSDRIGAGIRRERDSQSPTQ
jgi:hypothetical protein